ncbi:rhotekin-like isoform X1 [Takifugu flavidus]|uniref:rhotekin-like isoform X1 n=2 Tax=Takifugu flavidus TaxID=433684 RepID=UPI0025446408|nr:rhotekin-like isoform X1 [Takifugu flavidus]XP_056874489.1 rhotekin-like isoform X1 [Takifugu flavidus]
MRTDRVSEEMRRNSVGLGILAKAQNHPPEERTPCLGTIAVSEKHCCVVFCVLLCGTEIQDTDLVMVDKTLTNICFEDPIIYSNVGPGFLLCVQLYSSSVANNPSTRTSGSRRRSRLGGSLGLSSGSRIRTVEPGRGPAPLPATLGPKSSLLAHTSLTLQHVQEAFKSHDLSFAAAEEDPFGLPLYGDMCCRLVAQPLCMIQPLISGRLQVTLGQDPRRWKEVYGVLRGQELLCFQSPEDLEGEDKPSVVIPIKKVCPEHVDGLIFGFGLSSQKCSEGNGVIGCETSQVPRWSLGANLD